MQARKLKYNFELHKRGGLAPKEFETSLTRKVEGLLESTGLNRNEPFIKEAIRKVKTQVCMRRQINRRPSVDSQGEHGSLFSWQTNTSRRPRVESAGDNFDDMCSFGRPGYRQQGQRRRRGQSRKEMYHNKQRELFAGALQPKFQVLFRDQGIPIKHNQDGYLIRGEKLLTATEFCNVVDQLSADFLKDLSRLRGDNQWRPTVSIDFRAVSELCEQILIGRNAAHLSVENDLIDEGNYHKWRAHVMVIISFAALMVVAEMTLEELNKLCRPKGGEQDFFLVLVFFASLIFLSLLANHFQGRPQR